MSEKRILVTGADGLVGSRFLELSKNRDYLHFPNQLEVDLTNLSSVHDIFRRYEFRAVINFAAFTDVTAAEKQRGDRNGDCYQVNFKGVNNLLEAIEPISQKTHFIQISTDMVFPGSRLMKGPYEEVETPNLPSDQLTWYGFTKAEAERKLTEVMTGRATILRLIYPVRARFPAKLDYLRKSLKLYDEGKLYPVFTDQTVSISYIDEVVKTLDTIIDSGAYGIFHAGSNDTVTPFELTSYLLEKARGAMNVVKPASLDEFLKDPANSPVRYPKYGGLSIRRTQADLGVRFSSWRQIVDRLVKQGTTP